MKTRLMMPLRKEIHEVQDDIKRLLSGEINQIQHVNQTLAYSIIGMLKLENAEVMTIDLVLGQGMVYSVVLIDGRL